MRKVFFILLLLMLTTYPTLLKSQELMEPAVSEPLWEYGAGIGFIHLEHYPAADEFNELLLPFPTFQYRGSIVRADDREGARAHLLKQEKWQVDLSGTGYPTLDSGKNRLRQGLPDIPWIIALGPQLITKPWPDFEWKLGLFQAVSTDFVMTRWSGRIAEMELVYNWNNSLSESWITGGHIAVSIQGVSRDLQAVYYEVPLPMATAERPAFQAQQGLMGMKLSYFQAFTSGRLTFYLGGSISDYSQNANKNSPLHVADFNSSYFLGLTYVLGESSRASVPPSESSDMYHKFKELKAL